MNDLHDSIRSSSEETYRRGRYTSIVYFHGMGTPKRYEELSRILDTLDRYAEAQADPQLGLLRGQLVRLESPRSGGDEPIAFIEFFRLINSGRPDASRVGHFRLYESYWSPAAAGGVSSRQVLAWILTRTVNPIIVLFSSWRAHQRLKRTFLHRLYYDRGRIPVRHFQTLNTIYRSFEGMAHRRKFPKGRFEDFLQAAEAGNDDGSNATPELVRLARSWRGKLISSQMSVLWTAATIIGVLAASITLAIGVLLQGLDLIGAYPALLNPLLALSEGMPSWLAVVAAILLPLIFFYSRGFFTNFLSDVVFWTTTFEKDVRYQKRRDILRASEATLRHVLTDPSCERVVIVAHSLGTAIAYESLLALGRRAQVEEAEGKTTRPAAVTTLLHKLSHLITFGSPIDRIFYFFNLTYSRYHRFNKVTDDLMGGTGDPPFRIRKKRVLQWINIRDRNDPVASRLFSPRGRIPNREDIIEVEVACSHVPNPVRAHVGYFDARLSAKLLFDACILNREQVQAQDPRSPFSHQFSTVARTASRYLAFLVAWALIAGAIAFWTQLTLLAIVAQATFLVATALLIAIGAIGSWLDQKSPLTLPA